MEPLELARLNYLFGDNLGWVPTMYAGTTVQKSLYKWFWGPQLQWPCPGKLDWKQTPKGLWVMERSFSWEPQVPDMEQWCVARWTEPLPPSQWASKYGTQFQWPKDGLYHLTSVVLTEGIEPNRAITEYAIGRIKNHLDTPDSAIIAELESIQPRKDERLRNLADARIGNSLTAFGNIPGCRGGSVSFGGYEDKSQ